MSAPLYAKRQEAISRIPGFWPLVFEQAPPDIDQYIQPSDSEIFAKCLTGLDVTRPEIPLGPEKISNETGHPRSLRIRFEFSENEWFTDKVLEKTFWYRRSADGSAGLVSEPVRVHWKKGKDVTQGLMDGAIKLWEARQKAGGNMNKKDLPEFGALAKTVENWSCHNTSFFTWFAFVSAGRWISAEESAEATKKEAERRRKFKEGVKDEEPEDEDDEQAEELVEVCEDGDDLATTIAEDLWPGAIKYFSEYTSIYDLLTQLTISSASAGERGAVGLRV